MQSLGIIVSGKGLSESHGLEVIALYSLTWEHTILEVESVRVILRQ